MISQAEAIHAKCLDCSAGYLTERSRCQMKDCPLYPFRSPSNKLKKNSGLSRPKAIRQFCLDCSGGSAYERDKCISENCPLYPHRNAKARKALSEALGSKQKKQKV